MPRAKDLGPLVSASFWSYLALSSVVLWSVALIVWMITRPFDRRLVVLHRFTCWWGFHYVRLMPWWKVEIEGRDKLPEGSAAVIVANHQSAGDILVLFGLARPFKWVSKAEVFRVPFIGWNMRLNDYVSLRRGRTHSILRMMSDCRRHLRAGSPVLLFPEGTRSVNGELGRFAGGAFALAHDEGVPVFPVVLDGTRDVLPKRGWRLHATGRRPVTVRVLDPIHPDPSLSANALRKLVRARMLEALTPAQPKVEVAVAS